MVRLLAILFIFSSTYSIAADKDPLPDMHVMAQEIAAMQKYMLTESDFMNKSNEESIKKSLDKINSHLDHLSQGTFATDPALKVNLSLLQQHISDAKKEFNTGSKPFSRFMLQSSLQMCIACHTRGKSVDFALPEENISKLKDEDKGDFYFATRQFEKGRAVYEGMINGYPANGAGQFPLRKALLSLAIFYTRVKEDPAAGAKYFQSVADRKVLPYYLQEEASAWAKEFQAWSKEKNATKDDKLTESQLLLRAKGLLKKDDFTMLSDVGRNFHIRRLRASVLLHKVLESPGAQSPAKGEALYYLGQIYHRISSNLFFRFGEMYLKACIVEYKKTAIARSCYSALEQQILEGYSGSSGINIPDEEEMELTRLKRLAF